MAVDPSAIIDALDDAILASAGKRFPLSYSIAGRSVTFNSLDAMMKLRREYSSLAADQVLGSKRSRARLQGGPRG